MVVRRPSSSLIAAGAASLLAVCAADPSWRAGVEQRAAAREHETDGGTAGATSTTEALGRAFAALAGPRVLAAPASGDGDADDDLLPDSVEHVLLLDPHEVDTDGDGVDDFLHAVQGRYPDLGSGAPPTLTTLDHEMRVVVTGGRGSSRSEIWIHFLFRFVGGTLEPLRHIDPFLDHQGQRFPIATILGRGPSALRSRMHPTEGLYVCFSMFLAQESELFGLLPCTIGATALLDQREVTSGSQLIATSGEIVSYLPTGPGVGVFQTLAPGLVDDPFWTTDRICFLTLSVVATGFGGVYTEVQAADCIAGRPSTVCPPTCASSLGRILFFPDGLRIVTAGGR
ncbi:MAG: hypothetical protein IPM29_31645 [Planctomycetes bacterium]|nr:hypothetical protein [Planctomycetota bacterium]